MAGRAPGSGLRCVNLARTPSENRERRTARHLDDNTELQVLEKRGRGTESLTEGTVERRADRFR